VRQAFKGAPFLVVRRGEEAAGSIEVSVRRDHGTVAAAAWRERVKGIFLPSLRGANRRREPGTKKHGALRRRAVGLDQPAGPKSQL